MEKNQMMRRRRFSSMNSSDGGGENGKVKPAKKVVKYSDWMDSSGVESANEENRLVATKKRKADAEDYSKAFDKS